MCVDPEDNWAGPDMPSVAWDTQPPLNRGDLNEDTRDK